MSQAPNTQIVEASKRFSDLCERLEYKEGYAFRVVYKEPELYLQIAFTIDADSLLSRKWYLSPHMTDSEFVRTCFAAIMAVEEHEAREAFLYAGRAVFGPHIDVDYLHFVAGQLDRRE